MSCMWHCVHMLLGTYHACGIAYTFHSGAVYTIVQVVPCTCDVVQGVLGSYNNRIHNFELAMVSLVILYILLLFAKKNSHIKIKIFKEGMS